MTHRLATAADAAAIAALRNATADHLTARHGLGPWSGHCTARGVLAGMRDARILVTTDGALVAATLRLATRKPWAIDATRLTPVARRLYLTHMAVAPERQRRGVGRALLAAAGRAAREWGAQSIALDAFDHPAGAGGFYHRCGFRECGRATYRGAPLVYFEVMV